MQIQRTPHGFDCKAATTPCITKSGKMRVYNAKDSTNKKEML